MGAQGEVQRAAAPLQFELVALASCHRADEEPLERALEVMGMTPG